jgi:peptide/nickel transport system permease protein
MKKGLWRMAIIRCLEYSITFFIILVINFFLPRLLPGGPLALESNADTGSMVALTPQTRLQLLQYYHLNEPLPMQFVSYLVDTAKLNFGYSIYYNMPVTSLIIGRLPWTILLMGSAMIISTIIGIYLGMESAWKPGDLLDRALLTIMPVIKSIPVFFLGTMMLFVLGYHYNLFPTSGGMTLYGVYGSPLDEVADIVSHLALPLVCLTLFDVTGTYLLVRNFCIQQRESPYVLMAEARGLDEETIKKHILRNSLTPIITRIGATLGFLIGGATFIETIFAYPGMGLLIYNSFFNRDYPVIQAAFLIMALSVLGCNLLADIICTIIDGRERSRS